MAIGSKAFESPMLSHARMRALYRGLVEVRALRSLARDKSLHQLEACLVAPSIDLRDGDLACDTGPSLESVLLEHIRSIAHRTAAGGISRAQAKQAMTQTDSARIIPVPTDGFPGDAAERLICAVGSAMGLNTTPENQNVVLAYARHQQLGKADWLRILRLMSQRALPLIVIALPSTQPLDLEVLARKAASDTNEAVPIIPVDAGDPVALYRVAQESMVRTRAGGGSAVIDAVACGTDPVKLLGKQLIRKQICTERWIEGVGTHLTKQMAAR